MGQKRRIRTHTQNNLFNSDELLSLQNTYKVYTIELGVIGNFHQQKHPGGSTSGPFDPKLNGSTTWPHVYYQLVIKDQDC